MLRRVENVQSPKIQRMCSLLNEKSRTEQSRSSCQFVRSHVKVFTDWCWAQRIQDLTVWLTACLGAQLFCRRKWFSGFAKREETIDT